VKTGTKLPNIRVIRGNIMPDQMAQMIPTPEQARLAHDPKEHNEQWLARIKTFNRRLARARVGPRLLFKEKRTSFAVETSELKSGQPRIVLGQVSHQC
jgi:hypothetical protein